MDDTTAEKTLKGLMRGIADFPKEGILFWDITPLLADSRGLALAIREMARPYRDKQVELVVGAESRGFIFGTAVARELNCGFVPVRKPGKLPAETLAEDYELEYGTDSLEVHTDAIKPGQRVLLLDDLLATGGTMAATAKLVENLGGKVAGVTFLIELTFLNGREKLKDYDLLTLLQYDGE